VPHIRAFPAFSLPLEHLFCRRPGERGLSTVRASGTSLAGCDGVSDRSAPLSYNEPTVMWRMRRPGGQSSHALLAPKASGAVVVWFLNERPVGYCEFDDLAGALRWSDLMQRQNWTVGWRLESDQA